jgi:hypothetical protein
MRVLYIEHILFCSLLYIIFFRSILIFIIFILIFIFLFLGFLIKCEGHNIIQSNVVRPTEGIPVWSSDECSMYCFLQEQLIPMSRGYTM